MEPDAATHAAETSLQRTYRYLRLAIVGAAVIIAVSVLLAVSETGVLSSISAYYYTPARNAIVGALIAASLGMLALSGRGVVRALLDVAALLGPLIALVPTPIAPGQIPGLTFSCGAAVACIPASAEPDVDNGVATYLIVGALGVVVALVLGILGARSLPARSPRAARATLASIWPSIVIAAVVLLAVWAAWALARPQFLAYGHFVATVGFFAILAVVSILHARQRGAASDADGAALSPAVRAAYAVIAALLVIDLIVMTTAVVSGATVDSSIPIVLIGEFFALVLFAAFWLLQTARTWAEPDPALRAG